MEILVCIKPVPDPDKYSELRIDQKTKRLVREGVPTVINPADRTALELALQLREQFGGKVSLLSMAPEFCRDKMLEGLAMGADQAVLLSDPDFGGADTYVTSLVLAQGIRQMQMAQDAANAADIPEGTAGTVTAGEPETGGSVIGCPSEKQANDGACSFGFDLILAGSESADGATSHVPAQLAEWLQLPHICGVRELAAAAGDDENAVQEEAGRRTAPAGSMTAAAAAAQAADGRAKSPAEVRAVRRTEEGDLVYACPLPAVISVSREAAKPRLVNAMGIIKARKKPLTVWTNENLGLDPSGLGLTGSPTKAGALFTPDLAREGLPLGEDAEAAADRILELIGKAGN